MFITKAVVRWKSFEWEVLQIFYREFWITVLWAKDISKIVIHECLCLTKNSNHQSKSCFFTPKSPITFLWIAVHNQWFSYNAIITFMAQPQRITGSILQQLVFTGSASMNYWLNLSIYNYSFHLLSLNELLCWLNLCAITAFMVQPQWIIIALKWSH